MFVFDLEAQPFFVLAVFLLPARRSAGRRRAAFGRGKTTVARFGASIWGGSPDLGFGVGWDHTTNNLEVAASAHGQMLLFLDEMANADEENVKAITKIMQGQGRGPLLRSTG
jgi:hypothetical protein